MLESLQGYPIDHIVAIDGRYKGHKAKQALSDDECLDLFESFQTPFTIYPVADHTQIYKRQQYFDKSKNHNLDVIIVIDSDDFIVHDKTNWPLFIQDLEQKVKMYEDSNNPDLSQSYSVPVRGYYIQGDREGDVKDSDASPSTNIIRVFYKPYELEYYGNHYTIRRKDNKVNQYYHSGNILCSNIMIAHDHALRSKEEIKQMDAYQKQEEIYEKEGRYLDKSEKGNNKHDPILKAN